MTLFNPSLYSINEVYTILRSLQKENAATICLILLVFAELFEYICPLRSKNYELKNIKGKR